MTRWTEHRCPGCGTVVKSVDLVGRPADGAAAHRPYLMGCPSCGHEMNGAGWDLAVMRAGDVVGLAPIDPRAADPLHHAGTPTNCRWCSASTAIVWVKTKANKAAMPIEVGVNESGNVEIAFEHDPATGRDVALAVVHASPPGMLEDWVPYMPHHATCARNVQGARS